MIYCSQGHQNLPGSRFCSLCGEKIAPQNPQGISVGLVLGDRYRVSSELGHGGFGRTYLAEDINRFNEPCVLKEFAPQVQGKAALQKAEELFAREAGVLYQLQHPQIPRFRELFRATLDRDYLLLVQDYVAGQTYRHLLEDRKLQGGHFSETEVIQLLRQLLPVLQYIHSVGVIHRDISPDNLMLRDADKLPVLIDFGGVKQVAAAVTQYVAHAPLPTTPTLLGKVGYAPPEQMQTGRVYPHSDLYALAVTVLVLLTAKEPYELFAQALDWQHFNLSYPLSAILPRMLATQPIDRFPTAAAVLQALAGNAQQNTQLPHSQLPDPPTQATLATPPAIAPAKPAAFGVGKLLLLTLLATGAGIGWGTRDRWLPQSSDRPTPTTSASADTNPQFSAAEQARKARLRDRQKALGIDLQFYTALVNQTFYDRYPAQQGRTLSNSPSDAQWRERWDAIAKELLDILEKNLSSNARKRLGSYDSADLDRAKQQVNQLAVGSRSLNDLTDARFFNLFPDQRNEDFIKQPIGQVWQAIAADGVRSLQAGNALKQIRFAPGTFTQQASGTLAPGGGRVYIATLTQGQIMRLNLQTPAQTALSIYLPRPTPAAPFLLSDSTQNTWSGSLPQSGIYEIVVVSKASQPLGYQLTLSVDNITSTPAMTPTATPTPKVEPSVEPTPGNP